MSELFILNKDQLIVNGKYKIINHLARGGFGNIYLANNVLTNTNVVIKTEQKSELPSILTHETKILHQLHKNKCGNIPLIHWFGTIAGGSLLCVIIPYYVASIYDLYKNGENGVRPEFGDEVFNIINKIGEVLEDVHKCGIIHRDIKPQNIMFNKNGDVVLIDFGLSTFYINEYGEHINETDGNEMIGSVKYVSLNVYKGVLPSRRDDYVSLFFVALFMYCGENFVSQIMEYGFYEKMDDGKIKDIGKIREITKSPFFLEMFIKNKWGEYSGINGTCWLTKMLNWTTNLSFYNKPYWRIHIENQQMKYKKTI